MKLYGLPISNATVERVFSRVTSTQTNLRNGMCLELLETITSEQDVEQEGEEMLKTIHLL